MKHSCWFKPMQRQVSAWSFKSSIITVMILSVLSTEVSHLGLTVDAGCQALIGKFWQFVHSLNSDQKFKLPLFVEIQWKWHSVGSSNHKHFDIHLRCKKSCYDSLTAQATINPTWHIYSAAANSRWQKKSHHNAHLVVVQELSYQGQVLTFNRTFYANMG